MSNFLTLHILVSLPWSNLNRDDAGMPKRLYQGGVLRGQLSSQSIKRGIRNRYEAASGNTSRRTRNFIERVAERALELRPDGDEKTAQKRAKAIITKLTNASKEGGSEKTASVWLSDEEVETAAAKIAEELAPDSEAAADKDDLSFIKEGCTGSLAIASFGRMFANAPERNTEAAIAVSPAVSTHEAIIETDYFSTVDDDPTEKQGAGSSYLGMAAFTNGVFYRSLTIDKKQLAQSWTGMTADTAREQLSHMVDALIYGLPRGKKNATAPFVMPALVLAEEQAHRIAYDFEAPVTIGDEGGYMAPSIAHLENQFTAARRFDPDNFGLEIAAGTEIDQLSIDIEKGTKTDLVNKVVDWILE
ncbi:MAG: type I-E CRISPR-associated protein Cas7/Cse4/CasC [Flaviflexus sp.]|nr:type I-E CRISPR-associated protein Cas7/Cse4/CasC [Flaviflexus sp.]